ncbi:MAG: YbbR-like domain-containing protein [Planctomycetota bacterium]
MEQVKLLSMTAVLTGLIWAAADSLVNEAVTARFSFELVPAGDTNMLVEIDSAAKSQIFEVQLAGSRRIVDKIQARDEPLTVRLPIGDLPVGPSNFPLDKDQVERAMAGQWREFRRLTILWIRPSSIPVVIDRMVTKEVDIVVRRLMLAYEVEPQLKRAVTTARLRQSVYNQQDSAGQRPQIDIASDVERLLRSRPPGRAATIQVTLDSSKFGPDARLVPDAVEVSATVKADRRTAEVPTVPIKPAVSFANLGKSYRAVAQDGTPLTLVTRTIQVSGPTDEVAALLRGDTRAYAVIQLKEADLADLGVFKLWTPEFHLPPNVELAEQPDPIEFQLISVSEDQSGD